MDSRTTFVTGLVAVLYFMHGASGSGTWGYYGDDGPSHWTDVDSKCSGSSQSPINIITSAVTVDENIQKFQFTNFDQTSSLNLLLENNGHTAKLSISGLELKVSGGGLPEDYVAGQLHFHWGQTDSVGSEHLVNGEQFPMEMHIVTYKKSRGSISNALSDSQGLAVLGFFFQVGGADHAGLNHITDALSSITAKNANTTVNAFKINSLFPQTYDSFFRYAGSLTTPTCNEAVIWTVFADTIKISTQQMEKFRTLLSGEQNDAGNYQMYNNFRPVQNLNNRVVNANFKPGSSGFRPSINLSLMILPVLTFVVKQVV